MKKIMKKKRSGQTIVEYILIVVLVAIASIVVLGLFSDTLRAKMRGVISYIGGDASEDSDQGKSADLLKNLDEDGATTGTGN
jgi:Flp pilus assembly pilin Flp